MTNSGNNDAVWVPLEAIGAKRLLRLPPEFVQPPPLDSSILPGDAVQEEIPTTRPDGSESLGIVVPRVPAGKTVRWPVIVTPTDTQFTLQAVSHPDLAFLVQEILFRSIAWTPCFEAALSFVFDFVPGGDCIRIVESVISDVLLSLLTQSASSLTTDPDKPMALSHVFGAALVDAIKQYAPACAAGFTPYKWFQIGAKAWRVLQGGINEAVACRDAAQKTSDFVVSLVGVYARDPNDKTGPAGGGATRAIRPETDLTYLIQFENVATATAAAQDVVVTDQLDLSKMDISTFSISFVSIGEKFVVTVPNKPSVTADIDLRPGRNLIARVAADLNVATGLLTVRIQSIDPATNEPTTDPLAGFLPPNTTPPQGQGSLFFSVRPATSLTTGAEIRNRASIVFDTNAAILTPEWLNTIDASIPSSRAQPPWRCRVHHRSLSNGREATPGWYSRLLGVCLGQWRAIPAMARQDYPDAVDVCWTGRPFVRVS